MSKFLLEVKNLSYNIGKREILKISLLMLKVER